MQFSEIGSTWVKTSAHSAATEQSKVKKKNPKQICPNFILMRTE